MRVRSACLIALLCIGGPLAAAESPSAALTPTPSAAATCVKRCETAESACSTQVRHARQDCSKKAASAGRDPMLMRRDYSTYFCGYFGSNARCARDPYSKECNSRFQRRHGLCVDAIQDNIAAQRYDCYLNERDAQGFCRDELRDCKSACGS
jgi:hypothetical protein